MPRRARAARRRPAASSRSAHAGSSRRGPTRRTFGGGVKLSYSKAGSSSAAAGRRARSSRAPPPIGASPFSPRRVELVEALVEQPRHHPVDRGVARAPERVRARASAPGRAAACRSRGTTAGSTRGRRTARPPPRRRSGRRRRRSSPRRRPPGGAELGAHVARRTGGGGPIIAPSRTRANAWNGVDVSQSRMITLCGSRSGRWGAWSHGTCSAPVGSMSGASTRSASTRTSWPRSTIAR